MPFNVTKFKVELKLAINRLKLLQAKKSSLNLKARREIAPLLEAGKIESATIRVENIIREDLNVEALEMAELYCELLIARAGLIDQSRTVDPGVSEAVHSLIYASARVEVRELAMLRDMLTAKYGKELVREAMDNAAGLANEKLVRKLSADTPPDSLIKMYLTEIASFYHVKWRPDGEDTDDDDDTPGGGLAEPAPITLIASESESSARPAAVDVGSGDELGSDKDEALPSVPLTKPAAAATAIATADELETEGPAAEPPIPLPAAAALSKPPATQPAAKAKPLPQQPSDGGIPSLEDLQRRFEALKRA
ncbi:Vacuolar protein sorting-associated protein ist1 [Coemansia furcata]|uniref:Vacuolar protein sorting-associated protein ist1 n=1 Tax=Coemansia furcata TaxID=417177 RepID=A0ACC1LS42_9FUNG|nr:Vacuolar protein sorting-associated protein ist1 [Coemansia furcata]